MTGLKASFDQVEELLEASRIASSVVERMMASAVIGARSEHEAFCSRLAQIGEGLTSDLTADELISRVGTAAREFETYHRQLILFLRQRLKTTQGVMNLMVSAIAAIAGEHHPSVPALQMAAIKFEQADNLDLAASRSRLIGCVQAVREEIAREKTKAASQTKRAAEQSREIRATSPQDAGQDSVTGLPLKDAAIQAIHMPVAPRKRRYVVVMVVDRIHAIHRRFGNRASDQILQVFGSHVAQGLDASAQLFRWDGPTFVAALDRRENLDDLHLLLRRVIDAPLEENLLVQSRSVLIPVSASWTAFCTDDVMIPEEEIEAFAASHGGRDSI